MIILRFNLRRVHNCVTYIIKWWCLRLFFRLLSTRQYQFTKTIGQQFLKITRECTSAVIYIFTTPSTVWLFLNRNFVLRVGFEVVGGLELPIKRRHHFASYQNKSFTSWEYVEISALDSKRTFSKEINVSFIVYLCLGKYGFSLDIFWIHTHTHTHTHTHVHIGFYQVDLDGNNTVFYR